MEVIKKAVVFVLTWEARAVLWRYRPQIVAITGSVGKTSAKDAVYAALSPELHVRKSEKSLNSDVGVPLTILGCETGWKDPWKWLMNIVRGLLLVIYSSNYPRWLILEVGADRPGDIVKIAHWLRPDIVIITSIPETPAHVEYFDSLDAVVREKRSLAEHLKPGGSLILNFDEERVRGFRQEFRGVALTYGLSDTSDFSASNEEISYEDGMPTGMRFRINRSGSSVPIVVRGALGIARVYAALAACAAAEAVGIDLVSAAKGLSDYAPTPGRMRLIPGHNGSLVIDDTYNSSPHAAFAALETLGDIQKTGRKIAVFGDMLELGRFSADAHRKVGERASRIADRLLVVGLRARGTAEGAQAAGMKEQNIIQYEMGESAHAGSQLAKELKKGDIVLVKGSQGIRMEKAVKELMAEPARAKEFLCRQDAEWEKR